MFERNPHEQSSPFAEPHPNALHFMTDIGWGKVDVLSLAEIKADGAPPRSDLNQGDIARLCASLTSDTFILYYPGSGENIGSCAAHAVTYRNDAPVPTEVVFKHNTDLFVIGAETRAAEVVAEWEKIHQRPAVLPPPPQRAAPSGPLPRLSELEMMQAWGKIELIAPGAPRMPHNEFELSSRELLALGLAGKKIIHVLLSSGETKADGVERAFEVRELAEEPMPAVFKHNFDIVVIGVNESSASVMRRVTGK